MEAITEKRRPTLTELQNSPEIVLRLEVAQSVEDAIACQLLEVVQDGESMLSGSASITPEDVIKLRNRLEKAQQKEVA